MNADPASDCIKKPLKLTFATGAPAYAGVGLPVFPLRSRAKDPLTPHGFNDASTDPAVIEVWARRWPDANIGLATGTLSRIVVMDVDRRHGGHGSLARLEAEHGRLAETPRVKTADGWHHWFVCPDGGCPTRDIAPGIHLRGDGAYVVVPPSVHPSGVRYRFEIQPDAVPFAQFPSWVLELATRAATSAHVRVVTGTGDGRLMVPAGGRNTWLASVAGTLRQRGLLTDEVHACLKIINQSRCVPPLPDWEVARIARSIGRYPVASVGLGTRTTARLRVREVRRG